MSGVVTIGAIALLTASSWALGSLVTRSLAWPEDPARLLAACRRQRITDLFGNPDSFTGLGIHLRLVYENPTSRLSGVRFFREPPTEAIAVFEIVDP